MASVFEKIIEAPTTLLTDKKLAETLRATLKLVFDAAVETEPTGVAPLGPLNALIVDGLDSETIFEEMQLRDKPLLKWARGSTAVLLEALETEDNPLGVIAQPRQRSCLGKRAVGNTRGGKQEDSESDEGSDSSDELEKSEEMDTIPEEGGRQLEAISGDEISEEDDEEDDEDEDESMDRGAILGDEVGYKAEEEDDPVPTDGFFNFHQMEQFADEFEKSQEREQEIRSRRNERQKTYGEGDSDDDDEDDDDGRIEYLDDGDESDEGAATMKYTDFFGVPSKKKKEVAPGITALTDSKMTKHEKMNLKVKKRIQELEETALNERPWELGGEVAGKARPENSLLEVSADWDTLRAAAPEVAAERTASLEEMIKERIRNERWDSVIPKRPPRPDLVHSDRDTPELSQEKSSVGLGEIYEKEYLHSALGVARDDEHAETRAQARRLFDKVCRKIDALSNFSFAPRPKVPDAKITPAVPAIAMEEILPMGTSQADAQAPGEVHAKKRGREGLVRSIEEASQEDRKRARAIKKKARRKDRRQDEAEAKLASRINPGLGNPYEKRKLVESLRGARNVVTGDQVKLEDSQKSHTSSSKFFEALAEEQKTKER